jgi:isoleucyl-tRNA synthetase
MPFSTTCSTTLSNFEAGLNYKDVSDPALMVSFPLLEDPDAAKLVAWTTTPWTLPSNLALCVHPDYEYVKVRSAKTGEVYIVADSRLSFMPGAVSKKKKSQKGAVRSALRPTVWMQWAVHSIATPHSLFLINA